MGLISSILESIVGRVHFMVFVGNVPAAEIELKDKEILVEIRNPILAIELGIQELLSGEVDTRMFEQIKKMGYKIKIKYKMLELEV